MRGPKAVHKSNFERFIQAAALLRASGINIISPAEGDLSVGLSHENWTDQRWERGGKLIRSALLRDSRVILLKCNLVIVLEGWERSRGARAEVAIARAIGIPVFEISFNKTHFILCPVPA
jgi:hypothetical protein